MRRAGRVAPARVDFRHLGRRSGCVPAELILRSGPISERDRNGARKNAVYTKGLTQPAATRLGFVQDAKREVLLRGRMGLGARSRDQPVVVTSC